MACTRSLFIILFVALSLSRSLGESSESCILTDRICQCSSNTPSGTCLLRQGNGTCLLGKCSEGYRCDCLGYELCSISKCGQHVQLPDTTSSETEPFPCVFSKNKGTCTEPIKVLDTTDAAINAEADATTSNDEATGDTIDVTADVEDLQKHKKEMQSVLKQLEPYADKIMDQILLEIDAEADVVECAVTEAGVILVQAAKGAKKASEAQREVRKLRRLAKQAEKLAKNSEESLAIETKRGCFDKDKCNELRLEVSSLVEKRKISSRGAAEKAKECREFRKSSKKMKELVKITKVDSKKAYNRCMQRTFRVLGRAKGLLPSPKVWARSPGR